MPVRKAEEKDIDAVAAIYEKILTEEENGMCSSGWKRGIYPTRKTAETALAQKGSFRAGGGWKNSGGHASQPGTGPGIRKCPLEV